MLPLIISALLFINWLLLPAKKWNPQIVCFLLLLGEMVVEVAIAGNTFSTFWATYGMIVILVFICIPLIHFVDSLRKITILINIYLLVFLYVGLFAVFNGGFGPAGSWGGQDENYVAAMMCMAMPLAYFSIYLVKGTFKKLMLIFALTVYALAVVVGLSRGGFVGMAVVFLYCLLKSPKKLAGISIGAVAVTLLLTFASNQYWQEMDTITDTSESTADLRLEAWTIAFRMFQHNPIFGIGPDNFKWEAHNYQSEAQYEKYGRGLFLLTHSMFFELLSELGLIGVSLFGAVLYYNYKDVKSITKRVRKLRRETVKKAETTEVYRVFADDCDRIRCYAYGLLGGSIGCLVAFVFLSATYASYFWVLTSMIVALREVAVKRLEDYNSGKTISIREESLKKAVYVN